MAARTRSQDAGRNGLDGWRLTLPASRGCRDRVHTNLLQVTSRNNTELDNDIVALWCSWSCLAWRPSVIPLSTTGLSNSNYHGNSEYQSFLEHKSWVPLGAQISEHCLASFFHQYTRWADKYSSTNTIYKIGTHKKTGTVVLANQQEKTITAT